MDVCETLDITLKVCGQNYPLTIDRNEEEIYREAERVINGRFAFYSNNYPGKDIQEYLRMAILEIGTEYVKNKDNGNLSPIMDTLSSLITNMEDALK